jgi:ABC-type transport system involved in cytochrome bd biosynthesis fused ATPase/permease subunit
MGMADGERGLSDVDQERRERADRRERERREAVGRREDDVRQARARNVAAAAWALLGALILLYLFFVAIGGISPGDATGATIAVGVLAILWLAHAWRRMAAGGAPSQGDRERRGF